MSEEQRGAPVASDKTRDYPEDEMSVAESIGHAVVEDEGVDVGHAGLPTFWIACIAFVLVWAMLAWKPWKGY